MKLSRTTWTAFNLLVLALAAGLFLASGQRSESPKIPLAIAAHQAAGEDGRPGCLRRYEARDEGIAIEHGRGPGACDLLGARDVTVYEEDGTVFLAYDGAGPDGWLGCLASSTDLKSWQRHGPILRFGMAGAPDRRYAGYPVIGKHDGQYFCYYVGATDVTGSPWQVPAFPYTMHGARARSLLGPWEPAADLTRGLELGAPGAFDDHTVTPGPIFVHGGNHWMIYSAAGGHPPRRTLALASAPALLGPWRKEPQPILPAAEQIENAALYLEPTNQTWFLFTNHVGMRAGHEYTDAIWMYWSADPLRWRPEQKAVIVDNQSLGWAGRTVAIGLPAVLPRDARLLIFYDRTREPFSLGVAKEPVEHCHRDIALASLPLPLRIPE